MKKLITVTGHRNCGKERIVEDMTKYGNVNYIKPYTDRKLPENAEPIHLERFHYVLPTVMEDLLRDEMVLSETNINGHKYVFFEFQLKEGYNVMIADDYAVVNIIEILDDVTTVRVFSENETQSDRVGEYLFKHEFDYLIDYDEYNPKILEEILNDRE